MEIHLVCRFICKAAAASLAVAVSAHAGVAAAEVHPDEPLATRVAEDRVVVTWSGTDAVDVYVGHKPALDAKGMHLVSDDDTDGRHEFHQSQDLRPYFLLQWERDGSIRRVAERVLALESGSNFRDVGGYETEDGRHVRWGLIYRSGAMPRLSDRDYEFLGQLGIRVLCDLRSVEERVLAPTRWEELPPARYVAVDYPASDIFRGLTNTDAKALVNDSPPGTKSSRRNLYREWPVSLAPQFQAIFAAMLAEEVPLAFNCSAGQDRTGVATALVLSALGVTATPETVRAAMIQLYGELPYQHAQSYRTMFKSLAAGEVPLAFNCAAGKDRTGVAAALLLTMLGVPQETVVKDYALSERMVNFEAQFAKRPAATAKAAKPGPWDFIAKLPPEVRAPLLRSEPEYIRAALAHIEQREGSIDAYFERVLSITKADQQAIHAVLLERGDANTAVVAER